MMLRYNTSSKFYRTCACGGVGEAGCPHPEGTRRLRKISILLVVFAGIAGKYHEKGIILGGLAALQTSLHR
jgi:hypothetical protein